MSTGWCYNTNPIGGSLGNRVCTTTAPAPPSPPSIPSALPWTQCVVNQNCFNDATDGNPLYYYNDGTRYYLLSCPGQDCGQMILVEVEAGVVNYDGFSSDLSSMTSTGVCVDSISSDSGAVINDPYSCFPSISACASSYCNHISTPNFGTYIYYCELYMNTYSYTCQYMETYFGWQCCACANCPP